MPHSFLCSDFSCLVSVDCRDVFVKPFNLFSSIVFIKCEDFFAAVGQKVIIQSCYELTLWSKFCSLTEFSVLFQLLSYSFTVF